jgi:hypothetical protein
MLGKDSLSKISLSMTDSKAVSSNHNIYLHRKTVWSPMPVILATQEAEIRRIMVRSQPRQTVCQTLSQKNPSQK